MDRLNLNYQRKKGFSLVEVLIVIALVAILGAIMYGTFNPGSQVDKGYDARKKKDLARIKVAFEEYYNDKGCYPSQDLIYNSWRLHQTDRCNTAVAGFPWLSPWPCQPDGVPYKISVDSSDCPKWYKAFAQLGNRNDSDIPEGWYSREFRLSDEATNQDVNYGVSSTNVNWYDKWVHPACYQNDGPGSYNCVYVDLNCQSISSGCVGPNCYLTNCIPDCQVARCSKESFDP